MASAAVLQKALATVTRDWIASAIGRSLRRIEGWFELGAKSPAPPLALLLARRADGEGFVLDDGDVQRVIDGIWSYRRAVARAA